MPDPTRARMTDLGGVVYITGLPASGKTTLAGNLLEVLGSRRVPTVWLDSDDLRDVLTPAADYTDADRDRFYNAVAHIARLGAAGGTTVVVSATASRAQYRDRLRDALGNRFVEVFLRCDSDTLRDERDIKGLYALADAGEIENLPGVGAPFDVPDHADVDIDTTDADPSEVCRTLLDWLDRHRPSISWPDGERPAGRA